eukprot:SM000161S02428  [mRNA]  locus=s161:136860:144224:- [translate_table: standard]
MSRRTASGSIQYLDASRLRTVRHALELAFKAHQGQKRKSGEPYIIHPVEVARILGGLEMDWETIAAGLLHDTVEDTELVTFEQIEELYGQSVRRIVEGETKVSKLGKMSCQMSEALGQDVKADDLRQMFLAMTEEVRVIIVKLADRLHNMRTLSHMPAHKQKYIAGETLQVFAPLARLLGMYRIKSELEDLSFMYAYPEDYAKMRERIEVLRKEQEDVISEAKVNLKKAIQKDKFLDLTTLNAEVCTLCKEPYSLYKKMMQSKSRVDDVQDIAQLRIILRIKRGDVCNPQQVCYHMLGLLHAMWPPIPGTLKDYIATPKPNGYQSLHTIVLPRGRGAKTIFPLEIQIRTEEMDKLAEWGIAAHHSGRSASSSEPQVARQASASNGAAISTGAMSGNGAAKGPHGLAINGHPLSTDWSRWDGADIARRVSWLNSIKEWQAEFVGNMSAREFVDTITGDLLGSRVFIFTPKGEVKNLPKGATVVDYAYHIHTDVGNKMVGAKVNGNLVSPTFGLTNADIVEVLTYDGASTKKTFQLHQQWLQHARTRSARHKLTKFLKEQAGQLAEEITADKVQDFLTSSTVTPETASKAGPRTSGRGTEAPPSDHESGSKISGSLSEPFTTSSFSTGSPQESQSQGPYSTHGYATSDEAASQELAQELLLRSGTNGAAAGSQAGKGSLENSWPQETADSRPFRLPSPKKVNGKHNKKLAERPPEALPWGPDVRVARFPPQASELLASEDSGWVAVSGWPTLQGGPLVVGLGMSGPTIASIGRRQGLKDDDLAKIILGFDKWQIQTVAMWHATNGRTVQWVIVNCLDRTGLLADVSGILTSRGLAICTHAGRTDRSLGVGTMLFDVEGSNSVVNLTAPGGAPLYFHLLPRTGECSLLPFAISGLQSICKCCAIPAAAASCVAHKRRSIVYVNVYHGSVLLLVNRLPESVACDERKLLVHSFTNSWHSCIAAGGHYANTSTTVELLAL